jgi:hypothetical protein
MKQILAFFFTIVLLDVNSQTFISHYRIVKISPNLELSDSQNQQNEMKLDTIDISLNNNFILIGDLFVYSNEYSSVLELTVCKTNVPDFIPVGKKIECFIDFQNKIIYDESNKSKFNFLIPNVSSLVNENHLKKIEKSDSIGIMKFSWENDIIEVQTSIKLPPSVKATMLTPSSDWGVTFMKSNNQIVELIEFSPCNYNFNKKLRKVKKICKHKTENQEILHL